MTWPRRQLSEIASIQGGIQKQPKRSPRDNTFPFLRVANVTKSGLDLHEIHEIELFDGELERYRLQTGDLLVVEGNGSSSQIGRAAVWSGSIPNAVHQNHLIRVRPGHEIDAHYLGLIWNSPAIRDELTAVSSSTSGLHTLSVAKLKRILLPVPEIEEQRRIVEILEDHLSHLDAAADYASAARHRLDLLFTRHVVDALDDAGGDDVTIGALAASVKNGVFVSRPTSEPDGVPILRIGAVRALKLSVDDLRYSGRTVSDLAARDELLAAGDLIFTRYNGNPRYVGACAVVPEGLGPLTYPDKLIRVRLDDQRVLPPFAAYACTYGQGRAQIDSRLKTSAGQVGISGRELKSVNLRIPSLEQQQGVVRSVEALIGATRRLDEQVLEALGRHDALRRAVLAAAFSGKLTGRHTDDEVIEETTDELEGAMA